MKVKKLNELNEEITSIHGVEFYDLMQEYRHSPIQNQKITAKKYENVKAFIEENYILKDESVVRK